MNAPKILFIMVVMQLFLVSVPKHAFSDSDTCDLVGKEDACDSSNTWGFDICKKDGNFETFVENLLPDCPYGYFKEQALDCSCPGPIWIIGGVEIKKNVIVDRSKDPSRLEIKGEDNPKIKVNMDSPSDIAIFSNVIFDAVPIDVIKGGLILGAATLKDSTVDVKGGSILACLNCTNAETGRIIFGGSGLIWNSTINGAANFPVEIDASQNGISISDSSFMNQGQAQYIKVKMAGTVGIDGNSFQSSKATGVIKIDSPVPVVRIHNNEFIAIAGKTLPWGMLFSGGETGSLATPDIEYQGYSEDDLMIKITNDFDKEKWGAKNCPSTNNKNHLNFELYLVKMDGEKIIGAYPIKTVGFNSLVNDEEIFISRIKKVKNKAGSLITEGLDNQNLAVLVHCEGEGTTRFSNVVEAKICGEKEEWSAAEGDKGGCIEKESCAEDSECVDPKKCIEGQCKKPPCTKDEECGDTKICKEYNCVDRPCSTNTECVGNTFCDVADDGSGVCEECVNLTIGMKKICTDGGPVIADKCFNGEPSICPINSNLQPACGGVCLCLDGFEKKYGQCVYAGTISPCPEGKEVKYGEGGPFCGDLSVIPIGGGIKKGGCSLIR